ncbi:primosomal protein N' [Candidatus Peregrinibacteria bacterium]|nr:primosomal protein N' [Candidatus Peregrinibacteria bacterium]
MLLTVVTASRSGAIGSGLTYEADDASQARRDIVPGSAVRVPLRKRIVEGIVIEVMEKKMKTEFDLRTIKNVLGGSPLLTEAQMKTVRWMADYYFCTLRQALQAWLPPPPWSRLLPSEIVTFTSAKNDPPRGKKARAVMEFLMGKNNVPREEIIREIEGSAAVIKRLARQGFLNERRHINPVMRNPLPETSTFLRTSLTPAQSSAYRNIKNERRPSLLFGVTGSGKTEIYAALIADAVRDGKQAILLVPEIFLAENVIDRFAEMMPRDRISILHSRLKYRQRKEEWRRIHREEVSLVIGSRSALFAPLRNLGLVIMDEEHEWTYKNEQSPRYHARETAEELCRNAGAKLLLGSATPSLESWSRAKSGNYSLVRLPDRYGGNPLPHVTIIDLAGAEFGGNYPFTAQLISAIAVQLKRKEQSVLFLNRRGAASALLCLQCRRRVISPESQLPFTVHHDKSGVPYLMDHATGVRAPVPALCPHCGSAALREIGAGTQRIEAILKNIFPDARILRADSDTLATTDQMRSLLQKMKKNEADILIGTQSVVKGLDLPNVTLAAVLIADVGLSLPHFRAGERIMQLLTQLTGRSGRSKPGAVIIQTFRPAAAEVVAAATHDTERYLDDEIKVRLHAGYPPAASMIRLLIRGPGASEKANRLYVSIMGANFRQGGAIKISVGPTIFGGGREWQVLLRGADPRELLLRFDMKGIVVDIDPVETI